MRHPRLFRFILVVLLGLLGSFILRLCLPLVALGQSSPNVMQKNDIDLISGLDTYSEGIADFFIKNAAQKDFSVTLDSNNNLEKSVDKELLNLTQRFGKLVLHAGGSLSLHDKISLSGNRASVGAVLGIQHQLEGVKIRPHFQLHFTGEASDQDFLSNQSRKLGSAELTFNGLLLKGVPAYLRQNQAVKELQNNGLVLSTDPKNNYKATLSKTFELPEDVQINQELADLRKIELKLRADQTKALNHIAEISNLRTKLKQAQESGDTELVKTLEATLQKTESDLQGIQSDLQNGIKNKYQNLAKLPLKAKFLCAPEFMREFKFPIFERRASSSGQGGSASAGIGVSGDVVIDINRPTCEFTFVPPFKGQSSTYADVSITSNGYFGIRGDAAGEKDFGATFSSNKYGQLSLSDLTFDQEDKDAINGLVLKSLEDAKNDERMLNDFVDKLEKEFVTPSLGSIEQALIGTDSSPFNPAQLCSNLFSKLRQSSDSDVNLVCWALNTPRPPEPIKGALPKLTLPPAPPLPGIRPAGACKTKLPVPPCRVTTKEVVKPWTCNWRGECDKAKVEVEIPPGCRLAKAAVEKTNTGITKVCNAIAEWEKKNKAYQAYVKEKTRLQKEYTTKKNQIETAYNKARENWTRDVARWNQYRDAAFVHTIAKKFIRDRVLLSSIDSRAIAKDLLDLAWDIEKGARTVNEWVDLSNRYLQAAVPERLSVSIAASGRIAFNSRSYILETRPQLSSDTTLEFKDKKPFLKLNFVAYRNGPEGDKGQIGGLDVIGVKFSAKQVACIGGKVQGDACSSGGKLNLPSKDWSLLSPTLGAKNLSKDGITIFADTVPLSIKS